MGYETVTPTPRQIEVLEAIVITGGTVIRCLAAMGSNNHQTDTRAT